MVHWLAQMMENMKFFTVHLHVVIDYFNFEMQYLLDDFMSGKLNFKQLIEAYEANGTENHDLWKYKEFFEMAIFYKRDIKLHAGVMPWPIASLALKG